MCYAILYSYTKERAGCLKPNVDIVEEVMKTFVASVYDRFHLVPDEVLKYTNRKVVELDNHVPSNVKKAYEPTTTAKQCAVFAWRKLH
ncbi:hypothetical protein GYH30_004577 [Glycine max]|uniref:Uncharacterized protein n=2 Tax=Glycine subgen. Soja TaxID=1462606 RepID=A0A0R0L932_SOYBN|nr:hypothetical protein GYH30_004577 [Glycine max]RZC25780.1 Stress-related protein [Glycine soja]